MPEMGGVRVLHKLVNWLMLETDAGFFPGFSSRFLCTHKIRLQIETQYSNIVYVVEVVGKILYYGWKIVYFPEC